MSRLLVALTVLALLATTCSLDRPLGTRSPKASPSQGAQSLQWSSCGGSFQCTTLKVPLDYGQPQGKQISLAVVRLPAVSPSRRIGSLLMNPGGPGASGVQFLKSAASIFPSLKERFDLVSWDPRGIGASAPVHCIDGPARDAFDAIDPVADDPQERQAVIDASKSFAAACAQKSGDILPYVSTENTARDMDRLLAAVGDQKLTYLGFSYGTYLGLWYAHLFPTHIRALALDGVVDPAREGMTLDTEQAIALDADLADFFSWCSGQSSCAFRGGSQETRLRNLMQRIDAQPLKVGSRELTRGQAMTGIVLGLTEPDAWSLLARALAAADQGDGRLLLTLNDEYVERKPDGTYSNLLDANFAVNCLDRPYPTRLEDYDAAFAELQQKAPFFGPAVAWASLPCAYWATKPTGKAAPLSIEGTPPILLVGGTGDPATPYAWAQAVAQQVKGSVLLTRKGDGHVSYNKSACAQRAIDTFLITLQLPAPNTTCT